MHPCAEKLQRLDWFSVTASALTTEQMMACISIIGIQTKVFTQSMINNMENTQPAKKLTAEYGDRQPVQRQPAAPHRHRPGYEKELLVRSHQERNSAARGQAGRRYNRHREENDGIDFLL